MGCISSRGSDAAPLRESTTLSSAAAKTQHEDKLELVFKAKRGNVFNQGIDVAAKHATKVIPKSEKQSESISRFFKLT